MPSPELFHTLRSQHQIALDQNRDLDAARLLVALVQTRQPDLKPLDYLAQLKERKAQLEAEPIDLVGEVSRQANALIELGFHEELGMSEEDYRGSLTLPQGTNKPAGYRGYFDLPLLIDPRVSSSSQDDLLKIAYWNTDAEAENLVEVPPTPYLAWFLYKDTTHDTESSRPTDIVGATQLEARALLIQYPEILERRDLRNGISRLGIKAVGSRYAGSGYSDTVPCLDLYTKTSDRSSLSTLYYWIAFRNDLGLDEGLVRGSQITPLGKVA